MDRRKFFSQSGTALGDQFEALIAVPRTGFLGLVAAGASLAYRSGAREEESVRGAALKVSRPLVRTGEALNNSGHPFGGTVTAMSLIELPKSHLDPGSARVALVTAHAEGGLSVLELAFQKERWRHLTSTDRNRSFGASSPIPLEGGTLNNQGVLQKHESMAQGLGVIETFCPTPWGTVLCSERNGWILELNPLNGLAIKKFSLGMLGAERVALKADAGQPIEIHMLARGKVSKFVSHQRFDARRLDLNARILSIGKLERDLDPEKNTVPFAEPALELEFSGFRFSARPCDGGSAIWVL